MTTDQPTLSWDVYVVAGIPMAIAAGPDGYGPPPGHTGRSWSPIAATLICGQRDAVLVDPLMTLGQGRALADWVAATGKNLTTVYVTHGHGDHWLGLTAIRDRFPRVRAVATSAVVARMHEQGSPRSLAGFWSRLFPGQIPDPIVLAEPLAGFSIDLEGHELIPIQVGHTDTDDTTILHVPAIRLVVAGDVAYNDVHVYLGESSPQGRQEWVAALNSIESLNPRAVVAGHKRAGTDDHPRIIEQTRQYIRDFDRIAATATTARELYDRVLALHPDRVNPGALWLSAHAVTAQP
jgi:glyoxylase-like metal-dependent hydrolase (beta-lactamase superfamily II)